MSMTVQPGVRIGYFTNTYPRATDTFIQREIAGLRERGIDVRTFAVRQAGSAHEVGAEIRTERENTFYVLPVGAMRLLAMNLLALRSSPARFFATLTLAWTTARPGWRGLLYQAFYFQEAVVLARELKRQGIAHLHNHLGDASGTVSLLASRLSGTGYSITFHGPHIFFDPTHWALREKLKYSCFVACISYFCRSQMMLFTDAGDWSRLQIVRCGVDPQKYTFEPPKARARSLLYTGRLAAEKGVPVLFESLAMLQASGYDFELILVGDGDDRTELEALATSKGISARVKFAGFANQAEVLAHLRQADVFVLPSFAEGVPVSLMEAMACGIPVIATYVGGVPELVQDGQSGRVVFPGDPVSLRDAIAGYLDNAELRGRVARNAMEKINADFNLNREIDKLAALFCEHAQAGRA